MANHYLLFSESTPQLSPEELAWFQSQLETVYIVDGQEFTDEDDFDDKRIEWTGIRGFRDLPGYEPEEDDTAGFDYEFYDMPSDRCVWFQSQEWGDVERVAHVMQKFLKSFRPRESWSLTFATTCSRPIVGEFGGGAVFVTARRITWHNAHAIVERWQAAFRRRKRGKRRGASTKSIRR